MGGRLPNMKPLLETVGTRSPNSAFAFYETHREEIGQHYILCQGLHGLATYLYYITIDGTYFSQHQSQAVICESSLNPTQTVKQPYF